MLQNVAVVEALISGAPNTDSVVDAVDNKSTLVAEHHSFPLLAPLSVGQSPVQAILKMSCRQHLASVGTISTKVRPDKNPRYGLATCYTVSIADQVTADSCCTLEWVLPEASRNGSLLTWSQNCWSSWARHIIDRPCCLIASCQALDSDTVNMKGVSNVRYALPSIKPTNGLLPFNTGQTWHCKMCH